MSCRVGDNCRTNKAIARRAKVPLVGRANHSFNLAMGKELQKREVLLDKINRLMQKLKGHILNAKILKASGYRLETRNITRWSLAFDMVKLYTQARDAAEGLDLPDVDKLLLTTAKALRFDALMSKMKDFKSVSKLLQSDDTMLGNDRGIFAYVIDIYPLFTTKLSENANIVACPTFDSAIVEVQLVHSVELSTEDYIQVSQYFVNRMESNIGNEESLSFTDCAFKR